MERPTPPPVGFRRPLRGHGDNLMARRGGNSWLRLGLYSLWLGAEAQGVIALRLMKLAAAETQAQLLTSVDLHGRGL
jgi:hypothetical protein